MSSHTGQDKGSPTCFQAGHWRGSCGYLNVVTGHHPHFDCHIFHCLNMNVPLASVMSLSKKKKTLVYIIQMKMVACYRIALLLWNKTVSASHTTCKKYSTLLSLELLTGKEQSEWNIRLGANLQVL